MKRLFLLACLLLFVSRAAAQETELTFECNRIKYEEHLEKIMAPEIQLEARLEKLVAMIRRLAGASYAKGCEDAALMLLQHRPNRIPRVPFQEPRPELVRWQAEGLGLEEIGPKDFLLIYTEPISTWGVLWADNTGQLREKKSSEFRTVYRWFATAEEAVEWMTGRPKIEAICIREEGCPELAHQYQLRVKPDQLIGLFFVARITVKEFEEGTFTVEEMQKVLVKKPKLKWEIVIP